MFHHDRGRQICQRRLENSHLYNQAPPDITDFLDPPEYELIQKELMLRYGVVIPETMKSTSAQLTYTKNSYILLIAIPRESQESAVNIYRLHPCQSSDTARPTSLQRCPRTSPTK